MKNGELSLIEESATMNMCEPETLSEFIARGAENYPADKFGLVLWNHGGVCYDENYNNDSLSLTELSEALSDSERKFEFIGFDACLMADYETACTIAPFAHRMLAPQKLESSKGWNYELLLKILIIVKILSSSLHNHSLITIIIHFPVSTLTGLMELKQWCRKL